jgi:peptidyl-dipeptidase A
METEEIKEFLDKQDKIIAPLIKKMNLSYWDAVISGKEEDYKEYERLQLEIEKIFNNKENFNKINEFLKEEINDEIIHRRLKLLYTSYLGSQGDINLIKEIINKSTKIEKEFNIFRPRIKNKEVSDNEITNILKTETDSEKLKIAWEASKKRAEIIEKELIELIKLRNKLAKSLGFDNYYSFSLEASEQTENEIAIIFNELVKLTDKSFRDAKKEIDIFLSKKYNVGVNELKPWHYQNLYFQEEPKIFNVNLDKFYSKDILPIAIDFYKGIGFDIKDILKRSDLYEKPGKYPHACCISIDRERDVRTIQNIKNNEKWMDTLLHELGHAIYSKNYGEKSYEELPFILRDSAHTFTTEAIALLFGRLSKNKSFIKRYCNISENEAEEISKELIKVLKFRELIFCRWCQVMFNFEKELYENPEQDLNKLWWDLVKKYQLIDFYRNKPDWASKIHLATSPVYYHNYLLGELLASQLNNYIGKNIIHTDSIDNLDYLDNLKIGEYLKDKIFSIGKKYRWDKMIKQATGENLNPNYFVEQFVRK